MDRVTEADVELAMRLADLATTAIEPFVADVVAHETKADGSPVSQADLAAEAAMVDVLRAERPDDGVLSEEIGQVGSPGAPRRWLLDPIDGTVDFVRGGEHWGTHVALEVDGHVVLGVITRPRSSRRWWAATGWGAFTQADGPQPDTGCRLVMSATASLRGAHVGQFSFQPSPIPDLLGAAGADVDAPVDNGSPVLDLVEGRLDAIVCFRCGYPWDHAPAVALVREAGGRFVDPTGGDSCACHGGVYANAFLADELVAVLTDAHVELAGAPE